MLGPESAVPHDVVSITDAAQVESLIAARRPDVVFNCAAYNAVDQAETEPDAALEVNRDGVAYVAAACARHGAGLVHYSTNYVFDGKLDRPYVESDRARPLNAYGFSKFAGEGKVMAAHPAALVVRTSAVYGHVGAGFPERIVGRVRRHGELEVVHDQQVNPTYAPDLAHESLRLVDQGISGIVHVAGGGCCAWDELARAVLDELREEAPIWPLTSDQLHLRARRPLNGCLASERVQALRPWREALRDWALRFEKA